MPSSLLCGNARLFTSNLSSRIHESYSIGRINKNPFQIPKEFLRFPVSDGNPILNCRIGRSRLTRLWLMNGGNFVDVELKTSRESETVIGDDGVESRLKVEVGTPNIPLYLRWSNSKMSLGDQAFFLLAFIACTISIAFTSLVIAAVPTLYAS